MHAKSFCRMSQLYKLTPELLPNGGVAQVTRISQTFLVFIMPLKTNALLFNCISATVKYRSNIATGLVEESVLAISTLLPCLNGYVLLLGNDNLTPFCAISISYALICMASSHLRNLSNTNRLIVVILKLAKDGKELASSTISARIGTVISFFFLHRLSMQPFQALKNCLHKWVSGWGFQFCKMMHPSQSVYSLFHC